MTDTKKCEYCDKRGVPIVPLRYAVAPAGAGAPKADGPAIALPATAAHYTRRLLRSGYLYVYDEARDRWDFYFVTPQAHYFKLPNTPGVVPILPTKPFDCPDEGHRAVASCITIPDAAKATKVWLGFSDVQWTEATQAKHADEAYRKRHMRCVDVKAFAASSDAKHCLGIHTIGQHVAEHAMEATALKKALGWGPFAADPRKERTARLIQEAENLYKGKGFTVTLDDPVGAAIELDALMAYNLKQYLDNPNWARELTVSNAIIQIESAVREQAIAQEESAAETLASQQISGNPLGHIFSERTRQQTEAFGTVTPAEALHVANKAWKDYAAKFEENKSKQWRSDFDKALKEFDGKFIGPLAVAHAAWMKSTCMSAAFQCNYDEKDPHSGLVYTRALGACIGASQDKAACFDLYEEWLGGSLADKSNLLLRALVLNLDKADKDIQNAMKVSLDWRGFPLDSIVASFGGATEQLAEGKQPVLGRLIQAVAGPIVKWMAKGADGVVRPGLVALAMHSGNNWVVVEVKGTMGQFRTQLVRELIRASGQPLSKHQVDRAVQQQLKRLKAAGVKLDNRGVSRFLVMVDKQATWFAPTNLSSAKRADLLAKAITTPEDVEKLTMHHWREQIAKPFAKGSIPFVTGLLGGLLQYVAVQKLSEDEGKAMSHDATEATWRLRAGTSALVGTITELSGSALEKMGVKAMLKLGKGLEFSGTRLLQGFGKALGIAGAMVMAWFDWQKGEEAAAEGQHGIKWAYRASAAMGLLAAACLLLGATGIGLILVAAVIVIGLFIEYNKDNKVQDWLERCVWGKGPSVRYQTKDEEIAQLKVALS